ncbi:MAG TPA: 6-phosphogluconolactonase [Solirubrobacterales bacterium]|jgi:6-phosphogluconolactonase
MSELEVFAEPNVASQRGAELIVTAGREAVEARGEFSLGLSGGKTPWRMIALLGDMEGMPWEQTQIFQVDERIAPPGDEARNLTHLISMLSIAHQAAVRPMPVTSRDLDAAAIDYESQLPDRLDLVHLGLGPDGHTASLVPEDPVLEVTNRNVALTEGEYQGHRRMTFTYPALEAARKILWFVIGEQPRESLAKLRAGDPSIPAGRVENDDMVIVADEAAAGESTADESQ